MSPRGRRRSAVATVVVVAAAVAVLGLRFADDGMLYYRTPSELPASEVAADQTTRLSGLVVHGSMASAADGSTLRLTDGGVEVEVTYEGRLPATVREGEGAVVEGRLVSPGVFHADTVLLRHSNEYRPAESAP